MRFMCVCVCLLDLMRAQKTGKYIFSFLDVFVILQPIDYCLYIHIHIYTFTKDDEKRS